MLAYVFDRALVTNDLPVRIPHRARVFRNPDLRAIFAAELIFELFHYSFLLNPPFEFLAKFGISIRVPGHVGDALHHFRATGIAAHSRKRGIQAQNAALRCSLKDSFHCILKQEPQPFFGTLLSLFRVAPFRDVFIHSEAADAFCVCGQGHPDYLDVHQRTVATATLAFRADNLAIRGASAQVEGFARVACRGHQQIQLRAENFRLVVAEESFKSWIAHFDAAIRIQDDDGERIVFRQRMQVSIVLRDYFFGGAARADVLN